MRRVNTLLPAGALVACVVTLNSAVAGGIMSAEFKSGEARPYSVAVLPAEAELTKKKVIQSEAMIDESADLEEIVQNYAATALEVRGYEVLKLDAGTMLDDPIVADLARRFTKRFEEVEGKMMRKPRQITKSRYTLDEDAKLLATALRVDGLVVPRVFAEAAAAGQMAKALLLWGSTGGSNVRVTVIDGRSGEIEAYFSSVRGVLAEKGITEKAEQIIGGMTTKAMKSYPDATEEMRTAYLQRADSREQEEEEVLGDLESLLAEPAGND